MIRLELKKEPQWLELGHGVRVCVAPCTTALVMAARAAIDGVEAADRSAAFVRALARIAILDWEGVADADGNIAEVSPEMIDALMDLWPIATAFERDYLAPALLLDAEKTLNGPRRMAFRRRARLLCWVSGAGQALRRRQARRRRPALSVHRASTGDDRGLAGLGRSLQVRRSTAPGADGRRRPRA